MEHPERITDSTRLVLGDWVCSNVDCTHTQALYRLVAWSSNTQRWLLYRDGLDPFISGWSGLMMCPEDLAAKGFIKKPRSRIPWFASAPVYILQRSATHLLTELRPGTDPQVLG